MHLERRGAVGRRLGRYCGELVDERGAVLLRTVRIVGRGGHESVILATGARSTGATPDSGRGVWYHSIVPGGSRRVPAREVTPCRSICFSSLRASTASPPTPSTRARSTCSPGAGDCRRRAGLLVAAVAAPAA